MLNIKNGIDKGLEKYVTSPTNKPIEIIIHNTGGTDANVLADTSNHTFENVKSYHKSKGWETIGYHYFIEKDGTIYQGRPDTMHGAHVTGRNKDTIGICLAGNFDLSKPTQAQLDSLKPLVGQIKAKYSISKIAGHRKYANKTCPGKNITDDYINSLMEVSKSLADYSTKEIYEELGKRL